MPGSYGPEDLVHKYLLKRMCLDVHRQKWVPVVAVGRLGSHRSCSIILHFGEEVSILCPAP